MPINRSGALLVRRQLLDCLADVHALYQDLQNKAGDDLTPGDILDRTQRLRGELNKAQTLATSLPLQPWKCQWLLHIVHFNKAVTLLAEVHRTFRPRSTAHRSSWKAFKHEVEEAFKTLEAAIKAIEDSDPNKPPRRPKGKRHSVLNYCRGITALLHKEGTRAAKRHRLLQLSLLLQASLLEKVVSVLASDLTTLSSEQLQTPHPFFVSEQRPETRCLGEAVDPKKIQRAFAEYAARARAARKASPLASSKSATVRDCVVNQFGKIAVVSVETATAMTRPRSVVSETLEYRLPAVSDQIPDREASGIFGLGVVLYEVLRTDVRARGKSVTNEQSDIAWFWANDPKVLTGSQSSLSALAELLASRIPTPKIAFLGGHGRFGVGLRRSGPAHEHRLSNGFRLDTELDNRQHLRPRREAVLHWWLGDVAPGTLSVASFGFVGSGVTGCIYTSLLTDFFDQVGLRRHGTAQHLDSPLISFVRRTRDERQAMQRCMLASSASLWMRLACLSRLPSFFMDKLTREQFKIRTYKPAGLIREISYDHLALEAASTEISDHYKRTNAKVAVPLPNSESKAWHIYAVIDKKPCKQFEIRMHKRMIDIIEPKASVTTSRNRLVVPAGVFVKIKARRGRTVETGYCSVVHSTARHHLRRPRPHRRRARSSSTMLQAVSSLGISRRVAECWRASAKAVARLASFRSAVRKAL